MAFFGTPDIASTMLERLLDAAEDHVALVVCQPDRPKGRGKKLVAPPVKALAEARGIEVVQPRKLRDGVLASQLLEQSIDLAIVVAYGRILPVDVFEAPTFATWNVHASLLPRHRGASPIQHAILSGDEETGVTLMQLSEGMDEGPMLLKRSIVIGERTGGELFDALASLGAETLVEGLALVKRDGLEIVPQPDEGVTYAPMIDKKDGLLDFAGSADALVRRVRAFDPWPGTFVRDAKGQPLKITAARAVDATGAPGTVVSLKPLVVATSDGGVEIVAIQPPGKKSMPAAAYLNGAGRSLEIGAAFP
ncbi:MAG: methionyl-tRNA formyltransferase [Deltaproteobacteria bacterium]